MKSKNKNILIIIAMVLILILSWSYANLYKTNPILNSNLPSFVLKNSRVKEAYMFAKENPLALTDVKCYCGCMEKPIEGRLHTRGIIDCFLEPDGSFETHGSNCTRCIDEALLVKSLVSQGKTKDEIIKTIDDKYKGMALTCDNPGSNSGSTCG
jgi:hypothetical protein